MKKLNILGLLLIPVLILSGCKKEQGDDDIILIEDETTLKGRVNHNNSGLIPIQSEDDSDGQEKRSKFVTASEDFSLAIVVEIVPPEYKGLLLRASHVEINDNYAYVTYNTEGESYLGGIDVIDISDINNPVLVSSALLPDVDLSSVAVNGSSLFLAGAADILVNPQLTSPAWVSNLTLNSGRLTKSYEYIGVDGYVATDVTYQAPNNYYVVSGDNGVLAKFNTGSNIPETTISYPDLRAVGVTSNKIVALSGEQGLIVLNSDLSSDKTIPTAIENSNAKRTIDFFSDHVLVSEGPNGLGVYSISEGSLVKRIPIPALEGNESIIDETDIVTNAVSVNGNKIFAANGGAGVAIYQADSPSEVSFLGGTSFQSMEQSSSNYVKSQDNYVFVASGKGGLKILKMIETETPSLSCNGTYGPYNGQTQFDWNINSSDNQSYTDDKVFNSGLNIGAELNWCGSLKVNGNQVNVNSGGSLNVFGALVAAKNMNVNSTVNLTGSSTIGGNLNINSGGRLTINGTLSQGASGSGSSVNVNGELVITGEVVFYGRLTINSGGKISFADQNSKLVVYGNVTNNGTVENGSITKI